MNSVKTNNPAGTPGGAVQRLFKLQRAYGAETDHFWFTAPVQSQMFN
jgi:hypothetical protein